MLFGTKIAAFVFVTVFRNGIGDAPNFRVLAPEFVCPNDEDTLIEKSDSTVITVKTDATDLQLQWTVSWTHLDAPSQRFILLLWRTVRALEAKLNAPQPEPFIYVIDNTDLLQGVEYIFNVTASQPEFENSTTKSFAIDNIKGDQKLMIEGRSDKFSVLLIGAETVYADMEYVMEAVVTTCFPTQDYYFVWSVNSASASPLNVSSTRGSRLEIPPYSLQTGSEYYVTCVVYRNNHELVTQTGLPFQVIYRGLTVSLNSDALVVTVKSQFDIKALVQNHDHYLEDPKFEWGCMYNKEPCEYFDSPDAEVLSFLNGLPSLGQYEITTLVTVQEQQASSNMTVYVLQHSLPVIQIQSQPRIVNEHTIITLIANASNVTPTCILTWYFANEEYLATMDSNWTDVSNTCNDCEHGEALADSVTIISLEESFLNELTDFTNETEWRQVTAEMNATAGTAKFVAKCGCSLTFSCDTQGVVYGDVHFELNKKPNVSEIKVSPVTGTAMETIFRLSTLAASDYDKPLRYSFYCSLGTDTLLLGSYLEHLTLETFLPYVDVSGTEVWVEVCDSLGACSSSEIETVQLLEGDGRTVRVLADSVRGHRRRCEIMMLRRIVQSAVTTYTNTNQEEVLSTFIKALLDTLPTVEIYSYQCTTNSQDFRDLLVWLNQTGVNVSRNKTVR